jgi:hypothetical protein
VPNSDMLNWVRRAAQRKILYLPHAITQMSQPERMISAAEIRRVIRAGSIIEDYQEDRRGHSCLMLGFGNEERPIHVVCAPKEEYLAIITAYIPSQREWADNFSRRKSR